MYELYLDWVAIANRQDNYSSSVAFSFYLVGELGDGCYFIPPGIREVEWRDKLVYNLLTIGKGCVDEGSKVQGMSGFIP